MDIIPSDLATYGRDAKSLLEQLQSQDQRLFLVTFLILTTGKTNQELDNNILQVFRPVTWMQPLSSMKPRSPVWRQPSFSTDSVSPFR